MAKEKEYFIYDDISKRYVYKYAFGGCYLKHINRPRTSRWHRPAQFSLERAKKFIAAYKEMNWVKYQFVDGHRPKMALRLILANK